VLDEKNDWHGLDMLYHRANFGEDRTPRAGCRCENIVFVCRSAFCHASRTARCSFEGEYFKQVLCCCLWVDFDAVFSVFSEGIALSDGLDSSHFIAMWCHNFLEIAVKKCEKFKNRRKSLCAPLRIVVRTN